MPMVAALGSRSGRRAIGGRQPGLGAPILISAEHVHRIDGWGHGRAARSYLSWRMVWAPRRDTWDRCRAASQCCPARRRLSLARPLAILGTHAARDGRSTLDVLRITRVRRLAAILRCDRSSSCPPYRRAAVCLPRFEGGDRPSSQPSKSRGTWRFSRIDQPKPVARRESVTTAARDGVEIACLISRLRSNSIHPNSPEILTTPGRVRPSP